jgi:hypothetical protein
MEDKWLMSNTKSLVAFTQKVADNKNDDNLVEDWVKRTKGLTAGELVEVVGYLTSEKGHRPADMKALREAIISEIELKNTQRIVETMESLDKSAGRLTWASILLALVGAVLAGIQVWQGFLR